MKCFSSICKNTKMHLYDQPPSLQNELLITVYFQSPDVLYTEIPLRTWISVVEVPMLFWVDTSKFLMVSILERIAIVDIFQLSLPPKIWRGFHRWAHKLWGCPRAVYQGVLPWAVVPISSRNAFQHMCQRWSPVACWLWRTTFLGCYELLMTGSFLGQKDNKVLASTLHSQGERHFQIWSYRLWEEKDGEQKSTAKKAKLAQWKNSHEVKSKTRWKE